MIRVKLVTEDRTSGGLEWIITKEVQARRAANRLPLLKFQKAASVNGNTALFEKCGAYSRYRQHFGGCDHVVYIVDARNVWDYQPLKGRAQPPVANLSDDERDHAITALCDVVVAFMAELAQAHDPGQWSHLASGFHAHVLVWELESLILPVAQELGLGAPPTDLYGVRQAAEFVANYYRAKFKFAYSKATEGPRLIRLISENAVLRRKVIASNPSLANIIHNLTSIV